MAGLSAFRGTQIESEEIKESGASGHGVLAGLLAEENGDVLICGGILSPVRLFRLVRHYYRISHINLFLEKNIRFRLIDEIVQAVSVMK